MPNAGHTKAKTQAKYRPHAGRDAGQIQTTCRLSVPKHRPEIHRSIDGQEGVEKEQCCSWVRNTKGQHTTTDECSHAPMSKQEQKKNDVPHHESRIRRRTPHVRGESIKMCGRWSVHPIDGGCAVCVCGVCGVSGDMVLLLLFVFVCMYRFGCTSGAV